MSDEEDNSSSSSTNSSDSSPPASPVQKRRHDDDDEDSDKDDEESEHEEMSEDDAEEPDQEENSGSGSSSSSESGSSPPPSLTRQRNITISYKEDSEHEDDMSVEEDEKEDNADVEIEEPVDTIERIMDVRQGKKGATGSGTTIYAIEENGNLNETLPDETETETQFFIKWCNLSHLHNTWESIDTLKENNVKGLKKLDNYCKKEDELNRWKRVANPEDIEYYECQSELQQELAKSYTQAERIIAEHRNDENEVEYFIKWDCLPYSDATWESGKLIAKRNPEVIKIYKRREASNKTPSSNKTIRSRPKFSQIKTQPDYMKGDAGNLVLRDYQLNGLNWLIHSWCKENSVILADEMGLGKTIQSICFLSYLFETQSIYGPFLLVVPLSTMTAWQKEFMQWAPQINVVTYLGDVQSRDIIREYEWYWYYKSYNTKLKLNAILTTYEIVLKDKHFLGTIPWAILMVDEAHRLKNGDSLLYKTLQEFNTNHRILITGTPLQNSLKELWCLLHFIMPHKFDDWETFEKEHDNAATKGYERLHKQLEPFILRRVKKDVEKSLPAKVEQILRVDMTTLQKQYYKWILTKNYHALRKGVKGSVSSFVNVVMELKKCCNHAMLVKPMESSSNETVMELIKGSGKLMLLDKLLVRLKQTGHRVLIFSQMVRMLDIIAEYLQQRRFAFQRLDGSIKGDLRKQALDHFNADGSQDFCFLLSTRAGGLGINLATADTVIIFDSDWNPQNDLQAQARAHRIGQKNQVNIYRLVTKGSVEEDIVERAKRKMVLDHLVIQRMDTTGRTVLDKGSKSGTPFNKDELTAILKFGAEELFKEDDEDGDDVCDIDEILKRAETNEDPGERPGDELLSAFKAVTFAVTEESDLAQPQNQTKEWDSIIPEDVRQKIEAEEKEKEMADLYLPPRSRTTVMDPNGNTANNNDALRKIKRKRKREANSEDESDSDDGKRKKRGRPKHEKGFTDNQIRKFIKSFKRFPRPLTRIDLIAKDCGLGDKAIPELRKLGEQLIQGCQAAMAESKAHANDGPVHIKEEVPADTGTAADGKKKGPSPTFKIAGINVNARTLSIALEELKPLGEVMPKDPDTRKAWKFELKAKVPLYDVDWGSDEDTRLLQGVWEYGTGAWETIRDSDALLKEKIFPETEKDKKPQLKHVQTRAEYLLKVIKKHLALTQASSGKIKKKKIRERKKEKMKVEKNGTGSLADGVKLKGKAEGTPALKKERKPRKPKKTSATVETGLDPKIFNECKEKMRPVKHALRSLDNPDTSLSEKEQIHNARSCLIQIGDQIQKCIDEYENPSDYKDWKGHLWFFVAQFTEFDATKLYKLYKRAAEKMGGKEKHKGSKRAEHKDKEKEKSKESLNSKNHHHHTTPMNSPPKKEQWNDGKREFGWNGQESQNSHDSRPPPYSKQANYERDFNRDRFERNERERPERINDWERNERERTRDGPNFHHHQHSHYNNPHSPPKRGRGPSEGNRRDFGRNNDVPSSNPHDPRLSQHFNKPPNYERDLQRERFARQMGEVFEPSQKSSGYVSRPSNSSFPYNRKT